MASQKGKSKVTIESPILPPMPNLHKFPLVDTQFKIIETQCEFDPYELHNWAFQKFKDASDDFISGSPCYPNSFSPKLIISLNS